MMDSRIEMEMAPAARQVGFVSASSIHMLNRNLRSKWTRKFRIFSKKVILIEPMCRRWGFYPALVDIRKCKRTGPTQGFSSECIP